MSVFRLARLVHVALLVATAGWLFRLHGEVQEKQKESDEAKLARSRGTMIGRSGTLKEILLKNGGGTRKSEAAVKAGLEWLVRNQQPDGSWHLDNGNHVAATAFGLLPFLGAGHTHKAAKENPYQKTVAKGLEFLLTKQNKQGEFGGTLYTHGLATIALCEAYALSKDDGLKKPAQIAVNFIIKAQHTEGGWRYSPGQPGDVSVTGWQLMALKTAELADLEVPAGTMRRAILFLDSACEKGSEGYCYVPNSGASPTMSAVGLLCRQHLQSWGPKNGRMISGVDKWITKNPPGKMQNMYYYYHATQVMRHFGGEAWKEWNEKMREHLIKTQDKGKGPDAGSWSPAGEYHTAGRVMQTSLCLLTLEVYYRYVPLFRD